MSTTPPTAPRELRRDARANRERILAAAREAFAESGMDAGMDEIARRAGVGVGTIYRRFPTKEALAEAILEDKLAALGAMIDRALEANDSGEGLQRFLAELARHHAEDRSGAAALASCARPDAGASPGETRLRGRLDELLRSAQRAGAVRPDVRLGDLIALLWGLGRVVAVTADAAPGYAERYTALVMGALAVDGPAALPGRPLSAAQITAGSRAAMATAAGIRPRPQRVPAAPS
jgi:AcrR family transcriptional regulator